MRVSGGGAALEHAHPDVTRHNVRERYLGVGGLRELHADSDASVGLLEGSLAFQHGNHHLANHDQDAGLARFTAAVPARQRFAVWSLRYLLLLAGVDALIGGATAALVASMSATLYAYQAMPLLCVIGLLFWPTAVGFSRGYRRARIGVGFDEFRVVMLAGIVIVAASALPAGFLANPREGLDLSQTAVSPLLALLRVVVVGAPIAVVLSLIARLLARKLLHRLQTQGRSIRHIVVAGSSAAAQQLTERIQREPHGGLKVIGLCLPAEELPQPVIDGIPVLGNLDQAGDLVRELGCDAVVVTSDDATRYGYLRKLAWSVEGAGVEVLIDPGLEEVAGPRLNIRPVTGFPLVHVAEPQFTGWRRLVKRLSDVVLACVGLIVIAPAMLLMAAIVKLQDGGPVIFRQMRVGRGGKLFTMLKFRSMVVDAEARKIDLVAMNEGHGALFKLRDDPRITSFGKFLRDFSLDELPQLFNVLRGSMSLVGPRPHLAQEVAQMPYEAHRRSLVTPGLTGLWQVSGRSDLEEEDAIKLDLRYVENWSLTLDLCILWKTVSAVLARRGAR
jgi:exopolysaccharide biosynthesis polyprenyl glycosylphosphotransferase